MTPLRVLTPRPSASRNLVCFPHAGGSANFFRGWATDRADVEVAAVQYAGRADRLAETCHDDLLALADEVAAAVLPYLERPTVFFGHSMGAILAFEVQRRLEAVGRGAELLVASAARAPHDPDHVTSRDTRWDEEAAVRSIVAMGQTDAELMADPRVRQLVLPYLRADFEMLQRYEYRPGPALGCDVLVVRGATDPHVTPASGELWRKLTAGRFAHEELPGGHFYLVPEPPIDLFLGARFQPARP